MGIVVKDIKRIQRSLTSAIHNLKDDKGDIKLDRDFLKQEGIHLVIHLDPVVTGDPRTNGLKEQVQEVVALACPEASIHDFRVVWGVTHSNIVFDAAVPFSLEKPDGEIRKAICGAVEGLDPSYRVVVNMDRESR